MIRKCRRILFDRRFLEFFAPSWKKGDLREVECYGCRRGEWNSTLENKDKSIFKIVSHVYVSEILHINFYSSFQLLKYDVFAQGSKLFGSLGSLKSLKKTWRPCFHSGCTFSERTMNLVYGGQVFPRYASYKRKCESKSFAVRIVHNFASYTVMESKLEMWKETTRLEIRFTRVGADTWGQSTLQLHVQDYLLLDLFNKTVFQSCGQNSQSSDYFRMHLYFHKSFPLSIPPMNYCKTSHCRVNSLILKRLL